MKIGFIGRDPVSSQNSESLRKETKTETNNGEPKKKISLKELSKTVDEFKRTSEVNKEDDKIISSIYSKNEISNKETNHEKRLGSIKQKITDGFYEQNDIIKIVADKLADKFENDI